MKKLIILGLIVFAFLSWKHDCEHIFVHIVQKEIDCRSTWSTMAVWPEWPSYTPIYGKQEGSSIICVKCLYKTKQILDHGEPPVIVPWIWRPPDSLRSLHIWDLDTSLIAIRDSVRF